MRAASTAPNRNLSAAKHERAPGEDEILLRFGEETLCRIHRNSRHVSTTAQARVMSGNNPMVMMICGMMIRVDVFPPVELATPSPPSSVTAMTTAAKPQSCPKSRQTIRRSTTSSPSITIVHSNIDDPSGCPLNMSSQKPSGKPIHAGQSVR